jgi:hypothetical protein
MNDLRDERPDIVDNSGRPDEGSDAKSQVLVDHSSGKLSEAACPP